MHSSLFRNKMIWVPPPWPEPYFHEYEPCYVSPFEWHKGYIEDLSNEWVDVLKPALNNPEITAADFIKHFFDFSVLLVIDDLFDRQDIIRTLSKSHCVDNWMFLNELIRLYYEKRYDENVMIDFLNLQEVQSQEHFNIALVCVRSIFDIAPQEEIRAIVEKLENSNIDENVVYHAKKMTLACNYLPDFRGTSPMRFMRVLTEMSPFMEQSDVCQFTGSMFHLILSPDRVMSARFALTLARNAYHREGIYQTSFFMITGPIFEYLYRQINEDNPLVLPRVELAVQLLKNCVHHQGTEVRKRDIVFKWKMNHLTESLTEMIETEKDEKRKEYIELIRTRVRDFVDHQNQSNIDPPSFGTAKGIVSERLAERFLRYCDEDKLMYC